MSQAEQEKKQSFKISLIQIFLGGEFAVGFFFYFVILCYVSLVLLVYLFLLIQCIHSIFYIDSENNAKYYSLALFTPCINSIFSTIFFYLKGYTGNEIHAPLKFCWMTLFCAIIEEYSDILVFSVALVDAPSNTTPSFATILYFRYNFNRHLNMIM